MIMIEGMTMPEHCKECRFRGFGGVYNEIEVCSLNGKNRPHGANRMKDCPLVEIPDPKIFAARMELAKCYFPKDTMAEILRGTFDPEMSHIIADRLICELLETLGYGEAVKIFEEMEKWYS